MALITAGTGSSTKYTSSGHLKTSARQPGGVDGRMNRITRRRVLSWEKISVVMHLHICRFWEQKPEDKAYNSMCASRRLTARQ